MGLVGVKDETTRSAMNMIVSWLCHPMIPMVQKPVILSAYAIEDHRRQPWCCSLASGSPSEMYAVQS